MEQNLKRVIADFKEQLKTVSTLNDLQNIEVAFFGRKGKFTAVMKELKNVQPEERKIAGQKANAAKQELETMLEEKKNVLQSESGKGSEVGLLFDATEPGTRIRAGSLHPHTQMIHELNQAFLSLGFEVYEGDPEIANEAYAFDSLNFPPDHPARESMDTYWLSGSEEKSGTDKWCLRPHLTGGSVRYMQEHKPPFRFVYPGRVFRSEATDASHERTFYQYEALLVDKEVPFSSGQVMVQAILQRVFGREVTTRMRAGFFPFVEPGFEIDMQCLVCEGSGCSVCGHIGWVEMMPGGPPHPNVLQAGGINPDEWQGFYINIGLDRIVMMKHGINDVRLFHSGDLRFLQQF